jgi:hypothetical protein
MPIGVAGLFPRTPSTEVADRNLGNNVVDALVFYAEAGRPTSESLVGLRIEWADTPRSE